MVTHELDQKIDIVDTETACAYEFKVSGKNAWAEFYKDVVKVLRLRFANAPNKEVLSANAMVIAAATADNLVCFQAGCYGLPTRPGTES